MRSTRRLAKADRPATRATCIVRLLEEVVDRAADRLERVAEELTNVSHEIFAEPEKDSKQHQLATRPSGCAR